MDCANCQEVLSEFIDSGLSADERSSVQQHLADCSSCAAVRDELEAIVNVCPEYRDAVVPPPNPQALWLRISNIIESETRVTHLSESGPDAQRPVSIAGILSRSWRLTAPQLAAGVAGIALAVALGTVLGLRMLSNPQQGSSVAVVTEPHGNGEREDRWREQQAAIEYWNQRVQVRKAQWNQQMRDAFERNLQVLDQAEADYKNELRHNPADEVSEEMLNSALNEKMALLKEFAEL